MEKYQYHIFSPYRVCPLGAHVDHQHGLVTGFAIDKGVDLYFDVRGQMEDGRCDPHVHLESKTSTLKHISNSSPCSPVMYPPPMPMPQLLNVILDLHQR